MGWQAGRYNGLDLSASGRGYADQETGRDAVDAEINALHDVGKRLQIEHPGNGASVTSLV
jgi:hypothetical protein